MNYRAVKICGLTRPEDAVHAAYSGADFIGMVMHKNSPRYCSPEDCKNILAAVKVRPAVLVFGNDEFSYVTDLYNSLKNTYLFVQYPSSGVAFASLSKEIGPKRLIPSVGISGDFQPQLVDDLSSFDLLVLDTGGIKDEAGREMDGGTGRTFDWGLVKNIKRPYLLAGGLNAGNVGDAAKKLSPFGFDVSGGVEKSKGIKDPAAVTRFIENARA